ncbi:M23 family metallopeptidase [Kribbella albertanoniae]|uniref:M23 family metallopeptidase n=1 Tax=Kribbella albertanoniae TaxID=1266829 RepID=A0A4V2XPK4_9ACTN|nr:M23 family metallopeptidase [Kribbella albertanoniae]TDC22425.1 M23 family metallopeptidase [Kribbella albertanoniae]
MAKHRSKARNKQRSTSRRTQLVGLTAALAATAGTIGLTASMGEASTTSTGLSPSQADALTAARVERRDLGSRDASRINLSLAEAKAYQERAARGTLTSRRALALSAAKAKAARNAAAKAKAVAAAKAAAEAKAAAVAKAAALAKARARAAPKVVLPTTGYHLTARFGQAGGRWARNHTGLDFAAAYGTPVRAVMAGEVIQAAFEGAYGRQVKIRHADGTVTSYSHMAEFDVSIGDSVTAGTKVGAIGLTGNTTGAHVHFEVLLGGETAVNPDPWLRKRGVTP